MIYAFDIETYPNFFCAVFQDTASGERWIFEMSPRRNDAAWLHWFLAHQEYAQASMVGYNSLGFDYPVLHHFMALSVPDQGAYPDAFQLYQKAQAIIDSPRNDWTHSVPEWEHRWTNIDVYKIMHFDNHARATSLKKLEVAMKSPTVEDLPVLPGRNLDLTDMQPMIDYCCWDVSETAKFAKLIWDRIEFRKELDDRLGGRRSRMNYNDTRIGKEYFLDELVKHGIEVKVGRDPIQTPRHEGIRVGDILVPIEFDDPDLQRIYGFFQTAIIPPLETKGFFTNLSASVRGFRMDFGSGGIHASIHKQTVHSTDTHVVIDADVTSYYPSLAIEYGFYPQHLTDRFVGIYADLKQQRLSHAKGTAANAMLKLALNGTYGESNNKYSSFYDPQFTMAITINGQLLLARLMELLLQNPECEPIQMNTDGVTVRIPRDHRTWFDQVCEFWSGWSRMELEFVDYRTMAIRDVNNYIAVDTDGKVKRKNAYLIDPDWHQDHSSLVVPKAVSAFVTDGTPVDQYIYQHTDAWDFMRSCKVPRNSRLMWGDQTVQNVTRYHIALEGGELTKVMPPIRGSDQERLIGIDKGWPVQVCNRAWDFDWDNLNRRWYLIEAEKLLAGLGL